MRTTQRHRRNSSGMVENLPARTPVRKDPHPPNDGGVGRGVGGVCVGGVFRVKNH